MKTFNYHPYVVHLHEVCVWIDKITREYIEAIIMDLCDDTLEKKIQINCKQKFIMNDEEFLRLTVEMVVALMELKKFNIFHRDIKPANILMQKGQIKLSDFDLSKHTNLESLI